MLQRLQFKPNILWSQLLCIYYARQIEKEEIDYKVESDKMVEIGFNENVQLSDGNSYNCIYIHVLRATTPKNPLVVNITPQNNAKVQLKVVMKGENNHDFHSIPMKKV